MFRVHNFHHIRINSRTIIDHSSKAPSCCTAFLCATISNKSLTITQIGQKVPLLRSTCCPLRVSWATRNHDPATGHQGIAHRPLWDHPHSHPNHRQLARCDTAPASLPTPFPFLQQHQQGIHHLLAKQTGPNGDRDARRGGVDEHRRRECPAAHKGTGQVRFLFCLFSIMSGSHGSGVRDWGGGCLCGQTIRLGFRVRRGGVHARHPPS